MMIWLLWFTFAQEPVDVVTLKGTFNSEQECADAMIANTIALGFSGQEILSASCEAVMLANEE